MKSDLLNLNGKRILVTGASSGIGRATAILCSSLGATLLLNGRDAQRLSETKASCIGDEHQILPFDLCAESERAELLNGLDKLDGIVFSAGKVLPVPVKMIKQNHIDSIFSINYNAIVLLCSQLFRSKKINNGASLVFLSSIASQFPYNGSALYSSTKAALEAFARSVALENGKKGIRANSIAPAMVKTPIFDATERGAGAEALAKYKDQYLLDFGTPEDVANTICFLLSDASKWITGNTIVMDGGLSLTS